MKKLITVFSVAAMITACNNHGNTGKENTDVVPADTAGLAAFKAKQAQDSIQALADSVRRADALAAAARKPKAHTSRTKSSSVSSTKNESMAYETNNAAEQKKGWSKKAKGAVIGAGAGAAVGAVVNKKNRVAGGVIGGVVGGAAGYGIGRHEDKKDGRN
jgi:hypothetical protein